MYLYQRAGIYYLHYKSKSGAVKRISTGCKFKAEANRFMQEFKEEPVVEEESISLASFTSDYEDFIKNNRAAKYARDVKYLFKELNRAFPFAALGGLGTRDMELFLSGRPKSMAALYYRMLSSMFNKAVKWNYIEASPVENVDKIKAPKNHPSFINEEEMLRICSREPDRKYAALYKVAFYAGLRRKEVINLRYSDVDIPQGVLRVRNSKTVTTKSGKERIIPMPGKLKEVFAGLDAMRKFRDDGFLVFGRTNEVPFSGDWIGRRFRGIRRKAGISEEIHFHSLRHSFGAYLAQRGVPIQVIKELMGHADIQTTMVYAHLQNRQLVDAMRVFDD